MLNEIDFLSERARVELERGEVDEAIWILEDVARRFPDSAATYRRLGMARLRRRNYLDARAAYRRALELDPDMVDAHHGLGSVLCGMGEVREGLEHFFRAVALAPDNAAVHNDIGSAFVSLGNPVEGRKSFQHAATLRPEWPVPLHNEALLCIRFRRRDEAMELMQRAMAIGASLPIVHLDLSMQLLAKCEFVEGWREYEWRWPAEGKPAHRPELVVPMGRVAAR